jgi:hypothetical protein
LRYPRNVWEWLFAIAVLIVVAIIAAKLIDVLAAAL